MEIPRKVIRKAWRIAADETSTVPSLPRDVRAYVLRTPNFEKLHERYSEFLREYSPFPRRLRERWEYGERVSTKQTTAFLIQRYPKWWKIIIRLENPNITCSLIHELKHIANADEDFSRMLDCYSRHYHRKKARKGDHLIRKLQGSWLKAAKYSRDHWRIPHERQERNNTGLV